MDTNNMILEGLTINQLEERLEMVCGILVCCAEGVTSCGFTSSVEVNVNVTINK